MGMIGGGTAAVSAILLMAAMGVNQLITYEFDFLGVTTKFWWGWNEFCTQAGDNDATCASFGDEDCDGDNDMCDFLAAADAWFAFNLIGMLLYVVGAAVLLLGGMVSKL